MTNKKRMKNVDSDRPQRRHQASPEWASGLRRLYDSVVEEPLPDAFSQLLDKLDNTNG